MSENISYITIDSVINDYLVESGQSNHAYYKLFHLAFRGMDDMGMDFFYQIKTLKLPINSNLTVTLPQDYRQWTKVGRLNSRGEIIPLWYNNKLTTFADLSPNRLTQTQDASTIGATGWSDWGANTWCNWWNGYSYVNIYGVPSGAPYPSSFKVDEANGVIVLDQHYREDYLMLEYISSPKEGQEYFIPVQFREALIAWLTWKDGKAKTIKSHMQLGANMANKSDYYRERRNAIARFKPVRIYDIYQSSQENQREAIKT